ncbi:polyprenol phosphomannose-dependent alpha 1,6 mannosyltransferase MptB [Microlunatus sp. Y2014]|uniref:polyprenol phosphomannose-dependent alpha 1,6 mannosyltransferase MptB n=1 Tax=Microlunatus sp. Y2014 TaxID=3418488 RepID=UPI003DA6D30B
MPDPSRVAEAPPRPVRPRPLRLLRRGLRWFREHVDLTLDALATWPVMEGVLGSFLLTIGALSPAFLPRASQGGGDLFPSPWLGTVLLLVGTSLILDGWFRLRPGRGAKTHTGRRPRYLAVLALWVAPLLAAPPMLSGDAYAYAAQGWLVANGLDPYQLGPAALPGPWADQVDPMWLDAPSPYGPLSLWLQYLTVSAVGDSVYAAAWGMRLWSLLGVGLLAWSVPRIAARLGLDSARAMWLGVLNPLVLLHFVGGAHNDALMMGFVALGLWFAVCRRNLFWAAVAVGLAAAVKQPAAIAVAAITVLAMRPGVDRDGPVRGWPSRAHVVNCVIATVVVVATFVLCSTLTGIGFGWIAAMGVPGGAMTLSPATLVGAGLQLLFAQLGWHAVAAVALETARSIGIVVALGVIAWLVLRVAARKPMTYLVGSFLALVLGGPAMHAWYLLWPGVLVGLLPYAEKLWRVCIWLTTFWVCYAVADVAFRNQSPVLAGLALLVSGVQVLNDERKWRLTWGQGST